MFGLTLLVGGLAQQARGVGGDRRVPRRPGAVRPGAGSAPARSSGRCRDLFAAMFFLFFSFQIEPGDLARRAGAGRGARGRSASAASSSRGWVARRRLASAGPAGCAPAPRSIARGEFSIVIASLGAPLGRRSRARRAGRGVRAPQRVSSARWRRGSSTRRPAGAGGPGRRIRLAPRARAPTIGPCAHFGEGSSRSASPA